MFQSPFAKPPGEGLSSSTVNVLWGAFNFGAGYVLVCQVGDFDLRNPFDVGVAGLGATAIAVMLARGFGPVSRGQFSREVMGCYFAQ